MDAFFLVEDYIFFVKSRINLNFTFSTISVFNSANSLFSVQQQTWNISHRQLDDKFIESEPWWKEQKLDSNLHHYWLMLTRFPCLYCNDDRYKESECRFLRPYLYVTKYWFFLLICLDSNMRCQECSPSELSNIPCSNCLMARYNCSILSLALTNRLSFLVPTNQLKRLKIKHTQIKHTHKMKIKHWSYAVWNNAHYSLVCLLLFYFFSECAFVLQCSNPDTPLSHTGSV